MTSHPASTAGIALFLTGIAIAVALEIIDRVGVKTQRKSLALTTVGLASVIATYIWAVDIYAGIIAAWMALALTAAVSWTAARLDRDRLPGTFDIPLLPRRLTDRARIRRPWLLTGTHRSNYRYGLDWPGRACANTKPGNPTRRSDVLGIVIAGRLYYTTVVLAPRPLQQQRQPRRTPAPQVNPNFGSSARR